MKKHGIYALVLGFSSLLLQGCLETPSPVSEEQTQNEQEVATAAAVSAAVIDLKFTAATVTGSTGTGFTYSYTIKNQGTVDLPDLYSVSIQNYYSANNLYNDAGDVAAGGFILGVHKALAAGASHSGTFLSSIALPAGMNFLISKIDASGIVAESNENNNIWTLMVRPDLRILAAAVTGSTATGYTYSYTIKNQGTVDIPDLYGVSIQNYYSANTVFNDAGDAAAGGSILAIHKSLAAGASHTGTFRSSGVHPAGMNYLTFKIDWSDIVAESYENNNTWALLVRPDLRFTAAAVTGSTGTGYTYSYTIMNQGTVDIPDLYNISIQNFYSANTIFNDAGDVAAGGAILGIHKPLAAGASHSGTFQSSGGAPAGKPYLICKIDWSNFVAESNETNNTVTLQIP